MFEVLKFFTSRDGVGDEKVSTRFCCQSLSCIPALTSDNSVAYLSLKITSEHLRASLTASIIVTPSLEVGISIIGCIKFLTT